MNKVDIVREVNKLRHNKEAESTMRISLDQYTQYQ